jgi:hypothetical protein
VCRALADVHAETVMGMSDPANHRVWLIFAACTESRSGIRTSVFGSTRVRPCLMQEGPDLNVILSKEKSGYYVYVGTTSQLGGKAKVSKYSVAEVKLFQVEEPTK